MLMLSNVEASKRPKISPLITQNWLFGPKSLQNGKKLIRISYFFSKAQSKIGFWQCDSYNSLCEIFRPQERLKIAPKCQKMTFLTKMTTKPKVNKNCSLFWADISDFDNMSISETDMPRGTQNDPLKWWKMMFLTKVVTKRIAI